METVLAILGIMGTLAGAIIGAAMGLFEKHLIFKAQREERHREHLSELQQKLFECDQKLDKDIIFISKVEKQRHHSNEYIASATRFFKELDMLLASSGDDYLIALRKKLATIPDDIPEEDYSPLLKMLHYSKIIIEAVEYLGKAIR